MIPGTLMMPQWCAGSGAFPWLVSAPYDYVQSVSVVILCTPQCLLYEVPTLVRGLEPSTWTRLNAMELSQISWSVHTLDCTIMTVITEKMLQLNVQVNKGTEQYSFNIWHT